MIGAFLHSLAEDLNFKNKNYSSATEAWLRLLL
jgi:hypothetical protein